MQELADIYERRTAADVVFDHLNEEIVTLKLLPGTKLSEAEIARRYGVSRQPVREAFTRLANRDLLLIRPQRATEVRGFSMQRIAHARFVRLAIELEVVRRACAVWDSQRAETLDTILDRQSDAVAAGNPAEFHALDYDFHKLICELAGYPLAAETIQESKSKIDRLCVLSLGREAEADELVQDHRDIAGALRANDPQAADEAVRRHLARLDDTIAEIHEHHSEYFE